VVSERLLTVNAGPHARRHTPMLVALPGLAPGSPASLVTPQGERLPAQVISCAGQPSLAFILPPLPAGATLALRLVAEETPAGPGVELAQAGPESLEVKVGGELFTAYHYGRKWAKPNFYPLRVAGAQVTRSYPIAEGPEGETRDHVHHISLWVAHGDLNGVDVWSEGKGHGTAAHRRFDEISSGPVLGGFASSNDWLSAEGKRVISERRWVTFWQQPDCGRLLDVSVEFEATEGKVKFGDTKEGGIISVRLATSMDGDHGGIIRNSYGAVTERETWGKRAEWVDYCGPIAGQTYGVTIYDHPTSFRYPTYWHVRDYGLFTANPFGLSHFYSNPDLDGSHLVPAGGKLCFRYRLYFHPGDSVEAEVAERYHDFLNPPQVKLE